VRGLDNISCQVYLRVVDDIRVLADAAAVEIALDPIRASILDALSEPRSATTIAAAVGLTRQKVNCHLKALEAHGPVELAEECAWGGITERFVRRTARQLVVAPDVLQPSALEPNEVADRSARRLRDQSRLGLSTCLLAAAIIIPTLGRRLTAANDRSPRTHA
jgi:DNA-binding transcriptional ArsR family regulator